MSSAEEEVQAKKKVSNSNHQKPSFLEVTCKGTRNVRRFAVGTEAGFALSSINRKLDSGIPPASYIEAFKEGEEPVIFGPSSVLVDYGDDWRLQAVPEGDYKESKSVKPTVKQSPAVQVASSNYLSKNGTHSNVTIDCVTGKGNASTQGINPWKSKRGLTKNGAHTKAVSDDMKKKNAYVLGRGRRAHTKAVSDDMKKKNAYVLGRGRRTKPKKRKVNLRKAFWESIGFPGEDSCDSDVEQGFWWGDEWITEWDDFSNPWEIEVGGSMTNMSADEILATMLSKRRERMGREDPFFSLGETFFGSLEESRGEEEVWKKSPRGKHGAITECAENNRDLGAEILRRLHIEDLQSAIEEISDEEMGLVKMLAEEDDEDVCMQKIADVQHLAYNYYKSKTEKCLDKIPKDMPGTFVGLKKGFLSSRK